MNNLPKIFLAYFTIVCIALFLTKCEKQADESATSPVSNPNTAVAGSSALDRGGDITSCIECDLEWRVLCDERRCDGGDFDRTILTLDGFSFDESGGPGACCIDYSSNPQWDGPPSVSQWQPFNTGILKSAVYPAMSPNGCVAGGTQLVIDALIKNDNGEFTSRMPGTLKIQFKKSGDNTGATLTQHNIPLNDDIVNCELVLNDAQHPKKVDITIENNCKVTSIYMVSPETTEPNAYLCPEGGPGDH